MNWPFWSLLQSQEAGRGYAGAVRNAEILVRRAVAAGVTVSDDLLTTVTTARQQLGKAVGPTDQKRLYEAHARLARLLLHSHCGEEEPPEDATGDPLDDAELLLKYAAESGIPVENADAQAILAAREAAQGGKTMTADMRVAFYGAYCRLARGFDGVTAQTIRNCSSVRTLTILRRDRRCAVFLTGVIVVFSVFNFMTDAMSRAIVNDIAADNQSAAKLRAGMTSIPPDFATSDPCTHLNDAPREQVIGLTDVEAIQAFASTIRSLRSHGTKLNLAVARIECDPFGRCGDPAHDRQRLVTDLDFQRKYLQINPGILNFTAEVLCKVQSFQLVRDFGSNVQADYATVTGAITGSVLPILYAVLGAYAYRLRLFGETIRKRTYHPSFSDSARMVTAVIAGAIAGMFNPAQGLSVSPLATAFLIGYGVELFFKFLDTLAASLGAAQQGKSPAPR